MTKDNDGTFIVFVDNQIMRRKNQGGIKRFFLELRRVSRHDNGGQVIFNHQEIKSLLKSLREIRQLVKKQAFDVIQHTYYNPLYCFWHVGVPCVSVIHDMIPEKYFAYKLFHLRVLKKLSLKRSKGIICVSQSTYKDLKSQYGEKHYSRVITLGGDHLLKVIDQKESHIRLPYIVYLGKRKSYKNAIILFESMGEILGSFPDVKFIFIGGERLSYKERSIVKRYRKSVKVIKKINDTEMATLLSKSNILVSTSIYEGFSLPVVEGASLGATVIASDNSAHLELVNNGLNILIFNLERKNHLVEIIINVLSSEQVPKSGHVIKSWDSFFSEIVYFYKSIEPLIKKNLKQ
jgi:glycosyltransferase involved in cell wall biosynthesis